MEHNIEYYFEKYLSDKGENGYSNVYNEVFSPRRNDFIRLLEQKEPKEKVGNQYK